MRNHLRLLAGVVGVLSLLFPQRTVAMWTRLGYSGRVDAEPRTWVHEVARIEGAILTLLALRSLFRAAESEEDDTVTSAIPLAGPAGTSDEE